MLYPPKLATRPGPRATILPSQPRNNPAARKNNRLQRRPKTTAKQTAASPAAQPERSQRRPRTNPVTRRRSVPPSQLRHRPDHPQPRTLIHRNASPNPDRRTRRFSPCLALNISLIHTSSLPPPPALANRTTTKLDRIQYT